jgi:hypothetical protein
MVIIVFLVSLISLIGCIAMYKTAWNLSNSQEPVMDLVFILGGSVLLAISAGCFYAACVMLN